MSEALYALLKQKKNVIKANLSKDPSASTEKAGLIRIATLVEALKGNEDNTAITPHTLKEVGDKKFGASIGLDLDPETFQLTMSLINGNGETLSSETIDLPSENALTDVDYDNDIKSLIFTYESGDTKTVSIEHVIDGLQPEITEDNKLPSDLVDDTEEQHKFVTPEEKQWLDDVNATANEINQLHESNVTKADLEKLHSVTADANELNILDGATLTTQELNYVDGVTSGIQDQLNKKLELNSLSIKSNSTNYLGYNNTNGQISAKVDTAPTNNSTKLITSGGTYTAISNHNTSGTAHDDIRQLVSNNTSNISTINSKIPQQASSSNQLADKDFVNSSISTNTANFIGAFASVSELEAYSGTVTNNDYAFVINGVITDNDSDWATFAALNAYDKSLLTNFDYAWVINGSNFDLYRFDAINQVWDLRVQNTQKDAVTLNTAYNRHKATVSGGTVTWEFEYTLNNSSFTADQWAAINSGATAINIAQIGTNTSDITTIKNNYVPKSRTINGKALSSNINLTAGDTGALPSTTTINDLTTEAQQDALNSGATTAKINQIITNQNDIADLKDLDGLSNTGNARLHALKSYADEGEILTDAEGLADVKRYAHSTFDLSKFTVVGSPNITDDGIASGFSSSNKITFTNPITSGSKFEIITKVKIPSTTGAQYILSTPQRGFILGLSHAPSTRRLQLYLSSNGTSWDIADAVGNIVYTVGKEYYFKVKFTGTQYIFSYSEDGINYTVDKTINSTSSIYQRSTLQIGGWNNDGAFQSSINLKQFSITVDGVEVFSGNKTGIDTIKPDDYTVVGTPTISADGIASGFVINPSVTYDTSMTCVKSSITLGELIDKDWMIDISFQYVKNTVNTARRQVILSAGDATMWVSMCGVYIDTSNKVQVGLTPVGYTDYYVLDISASNIAQYFNSGDIMRVKMSYIHETGTYRADILKGDDVKFSNTFIAEGENTNIAKFVGNPEGHFNIGSGLQNNNGRYHGALGSIDLNALKIYVDGDLVYQPCLKIPYTESKTGSKIVNAIYLDRVKDAYEQSYLDYQYYTLDEDTNEFTLPLGEVYGLISNANSNIKTNTSDISSINEKIPTDASSSNQLATAANITDINNKIPSGASSSNKLVATSDLSSYAYATNIVTLEDTSTITLANNTIYNGATLTDFTIALPATDEIGFICEIDFSSGTTATSVTYPNTITWIGDDISSNVFAPATNKRYTIMISYNGAGYVAVVKGINE